jgi:hypothetical protein
VIFIVLQENEIGRLLLKNNWFLINELMSFCKKNFQKFKMEENKELVKKLSKTET